MATTIETRDPKSFVSPEIWDREIKLLVRDTQFDRVTAERVFGQAIAYLITAIETYDQDLGIGCGQTVDMGVHAFILDTRNYREFCAKYMNGGFLEHIPEIERKADGSVMRTAKIIEENGFEVDWPLWEKDALSCTPCHHGAKCH
ncbi:hypothetical protein AB0B12_38100 [Streptomyces sp. NPDC044780]|uniref:glycine-rich domain-containing protein n=1 Tax=unclassified Streptomyces TaxID=2593676 RepID=UPI0033DC7DA8